MARAIAVEIDVEVDPELAQIPAASRIVGDPALLHRLGIVSIASTDNLAEVMMAGESTAVDRLRAQAT